MPETLLYQSRILLFGQKIQDLQIPPPEGAVEVRAATVDESDRNGEGDEDGVAVVAGDKVLVKDQEKEKENGIHTVVDGGDWNRETATPNNSVIYVKEGTVNGGTLWILRRRPPQGGANPRYAAKPYTRPVGDGQNRQLSDQFVGAGFAKIYGYSYEGRYYDLACPTLFMVQGKGEQITKKGQDAAASNEARAPRKPSLIGLSVADFQFSDEMRVWSYDKADFSIRMDVSTGPLEDILLEAEVDAQLQITSAAKAQISGAAKVQISHAAKVQIAHRSDR